MRRFPHNLFGYYLWGNKNKKEQPKVGLTNANLYVEFTSP